MTRVLVVRAFLGLALVLLPFAGSVGAADEPAADAAIFNTIRWATASELNNFGFDVYRGLSEEGPFERITRKPIAGAGSSDETRQYKFIDDTIRPGVVYHYYVEEISLSGDRKRISPIFAAPPKGVPVAGAAAGADEKASPAVEDKAAVAEPDESAAGDASPRDVARDTKAATQVDRGSTVPDGGQRFKIRVVEDAAYGVHYEDLVGAGLGTDDVAGDALALTCRGQAVPIHVADGGDGVFGEGDWFEFVGHGPGADEALDALLAENVYILDTTASGGARMHATDAEESAGTLPPAVRRATLHLEKDELLPRFSGAQPEDEGTQWFWAKLTHVDDAPLSIPRDLAALDARGKATLRVTLALRGYSRQARAAREAAPDHELEVRLGGELVATSQWNDTAMHTIEVADVPAASLEAGVVALTLKVPARVPDGASDPIVDVMFLDWVAVDYPRDGRLRSEQTTVQVSAPVPSRADFVTLGAPVTAYGADGRRDVRVMPGETDAAGNKIPPLARLVRSFPVAAGSQELLLVTNGNLRRPVGITRDVPSSLRATSNRADYLIVAHATLMEAVRPLADFYRDRGLAVELVEVEDVYDEFSDGLPLASGLKAFFEYAWRNWQEPRPRFVLLVGDASWDTKHAEVDLGRYDDLYYMPGRTDFARIPVSPYASGGRANDRNLVPTGSYSSGSGHAASDNWLVSFDGDDFLPELAIGRFPVAAPEEVTAIVNKTIAYASDAPEGAWRKSILWITNEEKYIQASADRLAEGCTTAGYEPTRIFPAKEEKDNAEHQSRIREILDEGQLLVHFHGHGGRFIWRTGPPDLRKNHDLFTLDDLDKLRPNERLPIVLSMSCYSAPFDHPSADSIGEKLLRLDGKGAIAVLAASWRNSPSEKFSASLLEELTRPGSIGEAIQRAKRTVAQRTLVEQYNLLGDPALELALPDLPPVVAPERPVPAGNPEMRQRMEAMRAERLKKQNEQGAGQPLQPASPPREKPSEEKGADPAAPPVAEHL